MGRDEIGNEDLHTTRLHRPPNVMFSKVFVVFFFFKRMFEHIFLFVSNGGCQKALRRKKI